MCVERFVVLAGILALGVVRAALAKQLPGQLGYEGQPGNQGQHGGRGRNGYEDQPGNQGG